MFKALFPLCLACLWQISLAQSTFSRVTFPIDEHQTLRDLARTGLDLTHGHGDRRDAFTTELSSSELRRLGAMGIRYTIEVPDLNDFRKQNRDPSGEETLLSCQQRLYDESVPRNFELGNAGGFLTMPQVLDQLDAMNFLYPNLVSVRKPIGDFKTWQNNSIFWIRISDNPEQDEAEPEILYTGLHHARELITVSQTLYYMWYLLENYDKNPLIRQLLDNTELYFVPVVNPDGMNYNIAGYDAADDVFRRFHRKNMRDNNLDGIFDPDIDGVDLNRNYGYEWGYDDEGSNGYEGSDTYRGPGPFSEPETQAIRYFCEQHDFQLALNYHSYGNLLVHPFGYNDSATEDSTYFTHYGDILTELNRFPYGRGMETVGYSTNGDSDDWMYGVQNIYSMTPEVGNGDDGFYPREDRIIPLCQSTLHMNLQAARLVNSLLRITDENPRFVSGGVNAMQLEFTRYGLLEGDITISFRGLSPFIQQVPPPFTVNLEAFEPYAMAAQIVIDPGTPYGASVPLEIQWQQGGYTYRDTLFKVRADVDLVINDPGSLENWETGSAKWSTTSESYKSGPVSITDSPFGPYGPNLNEACTLATTIDLGNTDDAYAQFWARWDIEEYYDYVLFQASEDGINWDNLCGHHSKPGSLFQQYEEPLYDGRQSTWVLEEVDLSDYIGKTIQLRFVLYTDGFVHRDGFYFDDFKVVTVRGGTVSTPVIDPALISVYPNPASDLVRMAVEDGQPYSVVVQDALGRVVFRRDSGTSRVMSVETGTWPSGLFHYQLVRDGQRLGSGSFQVIR